LPRSSAVVTCAPIGLMEHIRSPMSAATHRATPCRRSMRTPGIEDLFL